MEATRDGKHELVLMVSLKKIMNFWWRCRKLVFILMWSMLTSLKSVRNWDEHPPVLDRVLGDRTASGMPRTTVCAQGCHPYATCYDPDGLPAKVPQGKSWSVNSGMQHQGVQHIKPCFLRCSWSRQEYKISCQCPSKRSYSHVNHRNRALSLVTKVVKGGDVTNYPHFLTQL